MGKIYGPYLRKDGRQHLVIVTDDKRYTISYPKWLMEQHLQRKLEEWETVDHNERHDYETGYIDDYDYRLVAANEPSERGENER